MIAATRARLKDGEQPCIALVMDEESATILCRLAGNHLLGPGLSTFAEETWNALRPLLDAKATRTLVISTGITELYAEREEDREVVKKKKYMAHYGLPPVIHVPEFDMAALQRRFDEAIRRPLPLGGNDEAGPGVAGGQARPVQG